MHTGHFQSWEILFRDLWCHIQFGPDDHYFGLESSAQPMVVQCKDLLQIVFPLFPDAS